MKRIDGVFIDTSIFHECNYDFEGYWGEILPRFKNICLEFNIPFFSSSIIINEIKDHLKERAITQANCLKKVFNENKEILSQLIDTPLTDLTIELKELKNASNFIENMDQYFNSCKFKLISYKEVDNELIFSKYFSGNEPFNKNTAKKSEFPDAYVIQSILDFVQREDKQLLIISKDSDWQKAFNKKRRIIFTDSLSTSINYIIEHGNEIAKKYYELSCREIFELLTDEINNSGFYISDNDGEVIAINNVQIDFIKDYCLLSKTVEIIVISAEASVDLELEVKIFDEGNSIWDSEEEEYLHKEYNNPEISFKTGIYFEAEIAINPDGSVCDIGAVDLKNVNHNQDIEITVENEDYY